MKRIICLLLIIMIFVAGCTSFLKVDEDIVKDVSDKITDTLINTVGQERAERQESRAVESADKDTLNIISSVGNISIERHQADDTAIEINIASKAGSKERAEEILESYTYIINENESSIDVDTSFKNLLNDVNLSVDLVIYIPSNIKEINVSSNVGDINISGISGNLRVNSNVGNVMIDKSEASYNIKVDVGNINLKDGTATGDSKLNANTGEIDIYFHDISGSSSITAETGVGNIKMHLSDASGDSGYRAVINEFMKDERVETKNDQHTSITLTTRVGEIDFK